MLCPVVRHSISRRQATCQIDKGRGGTRTDAGCLKQQVGSPVNSPKQHANDLLIADVHSKQGMACQHLKSDHTQAPHVTGLVGRQLSSLHRTGRHSSRSAVMKALQGIVSLKLSVHFTVLCYSRLTASCQRVQSHDKSVQSMPGHYKRCAERRLLAIAGQSAPQCNATAGQGGTYP